MASQTVEQLSARLSAIASPQRLRILAALVEGRLHVSELARQVGMSRALLYMHLAKLEEAAYVSSNLELSEDGRAMKYYSLESFSITVDPGTIVDSVTNSESER